MLKCFLQGKRKQTPDKCNNLDANSLKLQSNKYYITLTGQKSYAQHLRLSAELKLQVNKYTQQVEPVLLESKDLASKLMW